MLIKTFYGQIEYVLAADEAQLIDIFIKPEYRRQGHGEELLREWLQVISNSGGLKPSAEITQVILEVRQSNLPAINLYKKLGFTELSIRKNYYSEPLEDAIVMRLELPR